MDERNFYSVNKLLTEIVNFSREHNVKLYINIFNVWELRTEGEDKERDEKWAKFEELSGVYVFIAKDWNKVLYIGKSKLLGRRIFTWVIASEDWAKDMDGDDLLVIISMDKTHYYMADSLETYLLGIIDTEYNKIR
jgi:predicted NAD/FAD-dependent oxidoreductase